MIKTMSFSLFFEHVVRDGVISLTWVVTGGDVTDERFIVMDSIDGDSWVNVGDLTGESSEYSHDRSYTFDVDDSLNSNMYFRVVRVDSAGNEIETGVLGVKSSMPNPDHDILGRDE